MQLELKFVLMYADHKSKTNDKFVDMAYLHVIPVVAKWHLETNGNYNACSAFYLSKGRGASSESRTHNGAVGNSQTHIQYHTWTQWPSTSKMDVNVADVGYILEDQ